MKAVRIRTEYLKNPLGIGFAHPRIFWNCEGGKTQTAYQIISERWNSGKVPSSSMRAVYAPALAERERVTFRIRLWDENDDPGEWSEPAFFEAGIGAWQAKWITGNYKVNRAKRYPADCFKKEFTLANPAARARLYITACGLYAAEINGKAAGDFVLAPGHTDYTKRIQYQTFDVTGLLQQGENALAVTLADGWYRGSIGAWGLRNQYGAETKLLAQLEIVFADGTSQTVATDESWRWSSDGPIRFADLKDGEIVDARRSPSYAGTAKVTACAVTPTPADNVPVTEHERFTPVLSKAPDGSTLLDFGQNMAGYIAFRVKARAGQKLKLRFGELLENGNLTLKNIQCVNKKKATPLQTVEYVCKEGVNEYKTTFAVFGFRYAAVETDLLLRAEDFTAVAVYSDLEETGFFESSNPLLDRFVTATKWSAKSNSADVPTDCPTRERHGWTGDAQIFFNTAAYLFDYAAFSRKYLNDIYDWQKKNGCLPQIAPAGGVDFYMRPLNGSVGWADAGVLLPYRFYKMYGDEALLRQYYTRMRRYAGFMARRIGKTGFLAKNPGIKERKYLVNAGQSYGEWAEPADVHPNDWKDMVAPHPEVSTAYTAYVLGIMGEIAALLGCRADAEAFSTLSGHCKTAYRALVETPDFTLDTDRQAQLVRPLALGLLDARQTAFARRRLLLALERCGWRLGTGFLSTPLILDVLADYDLAAAYRLLENEEMPGWLFMPKSGATTVWESWEGPAAQGGIGSLNHYSKGAVCEWLFKTVCGIRPDGENRFVIAPRPGGSLTRASAEYRSVYGTVKSGWEKTGGGCVFRIEIPANTTAALRLPNGETRTLCAGSYVFETC